MNWTAPPWGDHFVAVPTNEYEATCIEVESFFSRPLARYNSQLNFEHQAYVVFSFVDDADAERCEVQFNGEPFDPRDKGSGKHWMRWYKGRAAMRDARRSLYDFR